MANQDFIPRDDEGKAALFERFRDTVGTYSATLGLAPGEVTDQADDATWFRFLLTNMLVVRDSGTQWTSFKNLILNGPGNGSIPATPVTTPPVTPAPTAMPPGVLPRFRELCRRIKVSATYTDAIGQALGIVGTDVPSAPGPDLVPEISLRTSGGQVEVVWKKGDQEAIEIQKDSGSGWQLLAIDTRPNYIDTTPLPSTAAKWKYRAIYCEDSQKVGQWSNVAEITVGG
jgi:hypothetical protein